MSAPFTLTGQTILLISPEAWGSNFVSKHHYATTLAARGNRVCFLNPPGKKFGIKNIDKNLFVVDYQPYIRGINRLPALLRDKIAGFDINRIKKLTQTDQIDIVWSFDPYRFQNLKLFKARFSIYHTVDLHRCKHLEKQAADSSMLVLGVADLILESIKTQTPKHKIKHGLSSAMSDYPFDKNISSQKIKIGYVGNLHSQYLDTITLTHLVQKHGEWEFHFIGPYQVSNLSKNELNKSFINFLVNQENCILHGAIAPQSLPEYLNKCHLLIICYDVFENNSAGASNSHKILEYMASGRTVVSTFLDEYKDLPGLIELANNGNNFIEKVEHVVKNLAQYNSPEKQQARQAWARENTYEKQIERIESIIKNLSKVESL